MKLFDLDGTLIDSNFIWVEVDIRFLRQRGRVPTAEYTEYVAHAIFPTAAQFTKEYYGLEESTDAIMDAWRELARDAYQYHAPLKEGAAAYLRRCAAEGERMALFTAGEPSLAKLALDRHGLTGYFRQLIFAQELGIEKRRPEAFLAAAAQLGTAPEDCVMFDDSPRNCLAARTAGLTVVGVYDEFYREVQEQVRENAHRYIRSFSELLDHSVALPPQA